MFSKDWKNVFILAGSFIFSISVLLFIFNVLYGEFFFFSIFGGLSIGYSLEQVHAVFERFLQFYGLFFYASILVVYLIYRNVVKEKEKLFFLSLILTSFLLAISISFKIGSWVNYYTPFVIYSIMLIYFVISYISEGNKKEIVDSALTYFTIIIVSIFVVQQIYHYTSPFIKFEKSKSQHLEMAKSLKIFKNEAIQKKYQVFTFDKATKLFLFENTILPNTEFYHVSKFSVKGYKTLNKNKKLSHIIKIKETDESQFSTLKYYHVPFIEYKEKLNLTKYIIYEHER